MDNLAQLREALINGSKQYKAFKDAEDIVRGVESLQEKEKILKRSIVSLNDEKVKLENRNEGIDQLLSSAKENANAIISAAKNKAEEIEAEAKAKADAKQKDIDHAAGSLQLLSDNILEANATLASVNQDIEAARKVLDSLEAAKEHARKALGA